MNKITLVTLGVKDIEASKNYAYGWRVFDEYVTIKFKLGIEVKMRS